VIKALLHKISLEFLQSEEGNRLGTQYVDMQNHPGWKVHESILISVANTISQSMLSEEYTKLQALEKDAQQRGYFISKEIIDFLLDPLKGAKKYAAVMQHNKKMQEATTRRPKGKSGSNRKDNKNG
jgi:hypothetical protein